MFVHIYIHHFDKLVTLGAVSITWSTDGWVTTVLQEAHVNACYKHFYFFVVEFKLMDSKEFEPLVSSCHGDV